MKKRSLGLMVVLFLFTFGIYPLYWYIVFQSELKHETKEGFGGLAHLFMTLITFGIYAIYWQFAAGKRLSKLGTEDFSLIYLILTLLSLGFFNPFLMQNQANQL